MEYISSLNYTHIVSVVVYCMNYTMDREATSPFLVFLRAVHK